MHTTKLGELTVSSPGLGSMGMERVLRAHPWDEPVATIHRVAGTRY